MKGLVLLATAAVAAAAAAAEGILAIQTEQLGWAADGRAHQGLA
jgi:hypothetical protein